MKVRGKIALNGDTLSRAWMNELQVHRMKSDPSYSTLRTFARAVLPVADDRVAEHGKLHSYLIL